MMEKCDKALIQQYLAEELPEEEQLDFFFHVEDCDACWRLLYEARCAQDLQYRKAPKKRKRRQRKAA